jgi:NSS family neurotransmitter:Na+ symporter
VDLSTNVKNYYREVCLGGFRPGYWIQAKEANERAAERGPPAQKVAYVADLFRLSPSLVLGTFVTWLAIFLIIFKGVRNVGKVVMITVPLPVILLLIVLVRGLTLPGATTGLVYYLKPNWEVLKDPSVWIAAYGQIFFSLSLGFGILIAYASYMPPESDVTNSAFITSFGNCATSFLAGMAVFSVLGYLAWVGGQEVSEVVAGGPGLVFVTYPIALAKMPMGTFAIAITSFLFFACLISLGIDSAFSIVEGVVAGFLDRFPKLSRAQLSALFCTFGFGGSLFFCTRSGLMWLDIVDNWMGKYGLVLVGLLECVAVGYFFHIEKLKDYINQHSEIKVHNWFDVFIKVVTPGILIYLLTSQFLTDITSVYEGYDKILTHAVNLAGWGWFLFLLVMAFLVSRHYWLTVGVVCTGGLFLLFKAYLAATAEPGLFTSAELVAPALMAAVAAAILFGGLVACIRVAVRSRHMAGLSLRAQDEPTEYLEDTSEETQ